MGGEDRRAYFRVPARIAIRHRRARSDEIERFERELALNGNKAHQDVDPAIRSLFERIERKIDRVLAHLEPDVAPPLGENDVRPVEISGSGVRYPWSDPIAVGERVMVEMLLPGSPPRFIRAVGEVAFREEARGTSSPGSVALKFILIDESDREVVIRYTYEVQREALRTRAVGNASQ